MENTETTVADFDIQDEGTIVILYALTEAAKQWVAEHIPPDAMTWSKNGVVIGHHHVADIVRGIQTEGLSIKRA